MQIPATQIRVGMVLEVNGELFSVLKTEHITPGKGNALMQTKLRSLKTGLSRDQRFRSSESVERVSVDQVEIEFLYEDGEDYHFMNTQTFDQFPLSREFLGDAVYYLTPNLKLQANMYEGEIISIDLPLTVELEVVETEPVLKGATVSASKKPAKLSTGLQVQVPQFIDVGTVIKVDTRDGSYLDRVK